MTKPDVPDSVPARRRLMSRTRFLASIGIGVTVSTLAPLGSLAALARPDPWSGRLDVTAFRACVGQSFRLTQRHGSTVLTLTRVVDHAATHHGVRLETFTTMFRGPKSLHLEQGTYDVRHHRLGGFALFLVPMGRNQHGSYYEAVFNNLAK